MKCKVVNLDNKAAGEIDLDDAIFGVDVRADLLARMVKYQLAKRRQGTHKTKTVGEIAGSTAKPFRQKGTGRARQGSRYSAQQRGGQTTFGPTPRDHSIKLPKKVRAAAMKSALSAKQKDGKLIVLEDEKIKEAKTAGLAQNISKLGLSSALIVGGQELDRNFVLAAANIPHIDVLPAQGANVYDILRRDSLVLTRQAVESLQERLK
ncbi:MAG: 50S ribosomal protein L4 [Alphaproteobacteria bacterium]|nr:50S ribosomal protein L4 [Alphaproteobacteria bacterium]